MRSSWESVIPIGSLLIYKPFVSLMLLPALLPPPAPKYTYLLPLTTLSVLDLGKKLSKQRCLGPQVRRIHEKSEEGVK